MWMRDEKTVDVLRKCFQNNESAVEFAMMLVHICDVWDDLIDGDCVTHQDINRAMSMCLSGLPRNAFYRKFIDELTPHIEVGICNWLASDELRKRGSQKDLEVANVIRHDIVDTFIHVARLIGGLDWAAQCAAEIRVLAQNDTLEQYLKG
jgi:hypothetical protein